MRITGDHYQPDTLFEDTWLSETDRIRYLEVEEKKRNAREAANNRIRKVSKRTP